jgi:hypothetical protein
LANEKESSSPAQKSSVLLGLLGILAYVFGALVFSKIHAPHENAGKAIHPQNTSTNPNNSAPRQPSIITEVRPSNQNADNTNGSKQHTPLWEKLAASAVALGTLGLLVVNIFLLRTTKISTDAAKSAAKTASDQFSLTKRHAEDIDEAVFRVQASMAIGTNTIIVPFVNDGIATARHFRAHLEFSQNSVRENKQIALLATYDVDRDEIRGKSSVGEQRFTVPNINWNRLYVDSALIVSGTMQYDDGFDRIVNTPFCSGLLVRPAQPAISQPAIPARPADVVQFPCEDLLRQFEATHPNR